MFEPKIEIDLFINFFSLTGGYERFNLGTYTIYLLSEDSILSSDLFAYQLHQF